MTEYDSTNSGAIWKNDDKFEEGGNPKWPDFKGSMTEVVCPHCEKKSDYWVSAWKRKETASAKAPSLNFKIKPKEVRQAASKEKIDDEVPF